MPRIIDKVVHLKAKGRRNVELSVKNAAMKLKMDPSVFFRVFGDNV